MSKHGGYGKRALRTEPLRGRAGREAGKLYLDQLTEVCAAFDSEPDFLKMLTTPSIAAEDKQKVLKPCSRDVSSLFLLNFLMLVTDKGRIGLIHEYVRHIRSSIILKTAS